MVYHAGRQDCDRIETTSKLKFRQEENTFNLDFPTEDTFGGRLIKLFGGPKHGVKKRIANFFGVRQSAVTPYVQNEGYPEVPALIRISDELNCSLDWLLKGEGEPGGILETVGEPERSIVVQIAEIYGLEVEKVIDDLLREALLARAADMFTRYRHLQEDQREELFTIHTRLREAASKRQLNPRRAS